MDRYEYSLYEQGLEKDPEGEWVLYTDHLAALRPQANVKMVLDDYMSKIGRVVPGYTTSNLIQALYAAIGSDYEPPALRPQPQTAKLVEALEELAKPLHHLGVPREPGAPYECAKGCVGCIATAALSASAVEPQTVEGKARKYEKVWKLLSGLHELELPDNKTSAHLDDCQACIVEEAILQADLQAAPKAQPDADAPLTDVELDGLEGFPKKLEPNAAIYIRADLLRRLVKQAKLAAPKAQTVDEGEA